MDAAQRIPKRRFYILFAVLIGAFALLLLKLTYLQFFHPIDLSQTAERQSKLIQELEPFRGKILDRKGEELAIDLRLYSLGAQANKISNKSALADRLAPILKMDRSVILSKLTKDKSFVWIARRLDKVTYEAILALKIRELELRPEWKRFYPNKEAAGHLVGFAGLDHSGLEGVEFMYDSYLKGISGWKSTVKDAKQHEVVSKQSELVLPVDGYDLVLTLDVVLQHAADKYLAETCKKYNAVGGVLAVMDPRNGDILALANYPSYDPNKAGQTQPDHRRNRSITDIYEPGSVFKIFTVSGAIEEGLVHASDRIFCEYGKYRTGGRTLHDVHPYGALTVAEVMAKSSNIGISKIADKMGKDRLYNYVKKFGFGQKTDIDLPGEISGLITAPKFWSAPSLSSVAMGQEVGLTGIQLITATSAIANGGLLLKPRIVKEIRDTTGEIIKSYAPVVKRRVISESTSKEMREIMKKVVSKQGTGSLAIMDIPGVSVGGKTGTAQKIVDGAYSHGHFVGSFVGFVERGDKMVTILVSVDDPHPVYYGGSVAAPLFKRMAEKVLEYWR
ncbi:MAG: penicillin-binding protein [Candidatus Omnitrophica bacterium]|nr:penicillin-binding protein [Candidatus Omnitrophota bacterium]